jgi:hypothetical protein
MTASVVVVTYRRLANLETILAAWLDQTPEVWLCDCSPAGFRTELPIRTIRAIPDPGNRIRHAVATMTAGDLVIKADDDLVPLPGLIDQFRRAYDQCGDAIYGIHGRIFNGPSYYRSTRMFGPGNSVKITRVDFVGVITCTVRKYLPMDLLGCQSEVEDLFWQMHCFPDAPKYVIPTRAVKHLPESFDAGRLCANRAARMIRESFYKRYWMEHYAGRKR